MTKDPRPEIIIQLAEARELFENSGRYNSEAENAKLLIIFFHRNKFLNSGQAEFARKLIKLSQNVRTK